MLVDTTGPSGHMFEKSKSSTIDQTMEIIGDYAVDNDIFPIDIKEGIVEFNDAEKDANQGLVDKGEARSVMNGLNAITATKTTQINKELSENVPDEADLQDKSNVAIGVNNIEPTTQTTTELSKEPLEDRPEASKEQENIKANDAILTTNLNAPRITSQLETAISHPQEKEESNIIISQANSTATAESIITNTDQPKLENIESEPVTTGLSEISSDGNVALQESFVESESKQDDNSLKRSPASEDVDAEAQTEKQKVSEYDSQPAVDDESQVDRKEIYNDSQPSMEPDFRMEYSKNHIASAEKSQSKKLTLANGVESTLTNGDVLKPERIEVTLPDMFVSFMAMTPKVNPHYEQGRAESEKWIIDTCNMDAKTAKRVAQCNFSYFSAICAPDADPEGLRILCDWGNWVFPYDDMFDNGELRYDPEGGHKMIDATLSILEDGQEERVPETPLIYVHDTIWKRVLKNSPKGTQRRYRKAMIDYCNGAVEHVEDAFKGRIPPLEEYLAIHRKAAGVTPIIALVEYANKIDIPDYCFEHKSLQEITRVGTDVVLIQNDIVSYLKEETEGVNHNIVAVCRATGLSAQAAFDRVNELLQERYRDWYLAQAYLPQWGEEIDRQVQRYIKGVHETMLANLNFSFYSERYFGARRNLTRKDRKISVRKEAPQASAGGS